MSPGHLRVGELLVAAGAVALIVLLFLDWFGAASMTTSSTTGWSTLGWPVDALIVVTLALALWLLVATATARLVAVTLVAGVLTTLAATATAIVVAWRVLIDRPGLGSFVPDDDVTALAPAWLGLAAAFVLAAGAWWSLRDERVDAPDSAVVPPTPRPAPPA